MKKFIILASLLVTPALAQEILDPACINVRLGGKYAHHKRHPFDGTTRSGQRQDRRLAKADRRGQAEGGTGASGYAACTVIVPPKECLK